MASKVFPIRADDAERARWQGCADLAGLSFNAWARRALNQQVDLDQAVARLDEPRLEEPAPVVRVIQPDFKFRPDPKTGTKRGRRD